MGDQQHTDGPPPDPLAHSFAVTVFRSRTATTKREGRLSLRALAERVRSTTAAGKDQLPWLKLARFGEVRTEKGSFRHDANLLAISGIEADYDGERVAFADAVEVLTKAGVLAMVYTSPSHNEDAPRWRVLCPLSAEQPPAQRDHLLGRLNGLFNGIFSGESWALSQSYYYGSVNSNPSHRVEILDGTPIDQLDELDEGWRGKPNTTAAQPSVGGPPRSGPVDEAALLSKIISGESYHNAYVRLLGKWACDGVPFLDARRRVEDAMDAVPETERDGRWKLRREDIDRCLKDIYGKEARARDAVRRPHGPSASRPAGAAPAAANDVDLWPEPVDFLDDGTLTGTPELRPEHLPAALYPFVVDIAARMGVDPVSVALGALVTCASVVNEAWRIQPKQRDDTWTEAARLWGAIVGDPSILKTPVIAACTRPIERLDTEARHRHAEQMRKHQGELAEWKAAGSDPADMPRQPRLDRYLVEGTTVEALSEVLRDDVEAKQRVPTGRVLIRQDEMSEWLASFDRYRSGGRGGGDRGAYLRLYNGGRYVVDRVNRGTFAVSSWSACILGGIQPEPIQRIAREAADDGLLQRFIFCVPARQARGEDRAPDREALRRYEALIPALAVLHPPAPGVGRGAAASEATPRPVVLHAQAHRHRLAVDDLVPAVAAMPDTSTRLKAALGKWPGLFARLALAFHLIGVADAHARDDQPPPLDMLPEAIASQVASFMREILLPHLLRAEAVMFSTAQTGHARWIAGFILSRGGERLTMRDVVQAYGALRSPESRRELLEVMESLVSVGWLRPEPQANPARPPAAWTVNPAVHATFAVRAAREREARSTTRRRLSDGLADLRKESP